MTNETTGRKEKRIALEIVEFALEIVARNPSKIGIILCEGEWNSVDVALYSIVYKEFVVVPVGGCTDVKKLLPRIKRLVPEMQCFGIIDRDDLSKYDIKQLEQKRDIYTTRLPFIENIMCVPEIVKIMCKKYNKNYDVIIRDVRSELLSLLCRQIRISLPVNIHIPVDADVKKVEIHIGIDDGGYRKIVDAGNIMYVYRDKGIASKVADALGRPGRKRYYKMFLELINDERTREQVIKCVSKYLPQNMCKGQD